MNAPEPENAIPPPPHIPEFTERTAYLRSMSEVREARGILPSISRQDPILEVVMPMWGTRAPADTWGKPSYQRYKQLINDPANFNESYLQSLTDTFVAIRWLASQDGIDPSRLGLRPEILGFYDRMKSALDGRFVSVDGFNFRFATSPHGLIVHEENRSLTMQLSDPSSMPP